MGGRKRDSSRQHERELPHWLSIPEPNPPTPNRPLLVGAIALAVVWILCLIALAAFT